MNIFIINSAIQLKGDGSVNYYAWLKQAMSMNTHFASSIKEAYIKFSYASMTQQKGFLRVPLK